VGFDYGIWWFVRVEWGFGSFSLGGSGNFCAQKRALSSATVGPITTAECRARVDSEATLEPIRTAECGASVASGAFSLISLRTNYGTRLTKQATHYISKLVHLVYSCPTVLLLKPLSGAATRSDALLLMTVTLSK